MRSFSLRLRYFLRQSLRNTSIKDYTRAIEINPKNAGAYNNRANAYFDKGLYDEAISDCDKALKIDATFTLAQKNRERAVKAKNQAGEVEDRKSAQANESADEAIAKFSKAIEVNPRDADAYNRRGIAYDSNGDTDKAIADFSKAYVNRASDYEKMGELAKALRDRAKARQLSSPQ